MCCLKVTEKTGYQEKDELVDEMSDSIVINLKNLANENIENNTLSDCKNYNMCSATDY